MDRAHTRGNPAKRRSGNREYGACGREISEFNTLSLACAGSRGSPRAHVLTICARAHGRQSGHWNQDLYEDLVAPALKSDLYAETWMRCAHARMRTRARACARATAAGPSLDRCAHAARGSAPGGCPVRGAAMYEPHGGALGPACGGWGARGQYKDLG